MSIVSLLPGATEIVHALGLGVTRMVFLEWLDPPFSCGHWNPELVALTGGYDPRSLAAGFVGVHIP